MRLNDQDFGRDAMSRLGSVFKKTKSRGRPSLVAYLMAGDPSLEETELFARACERGGIDVIELGIPFSDPIADGPEIEAAGVRALKAGTRPKDVIDLAGRLRKGSEVPLVLMTYMNPILGMGLSEFGRGAAKAGVDGVIVPDLSLEESDEVRETLDSVGIDHVQLIAPSTPEERARSIAGASRGFLYVVARYGTTGTRAELPRDLGSRLKALKRLTALPLAIGFGVSTSDQVRQVAALGADGVVVGSAIVNRITSDPNPDSVEAFVRQLASGIRAT
jgi:tryptophan synthase alpha chain